LAIAWGYTGVHQGGILAFLFFLRRIFSVGYLMSQPAVPRWLKGLPVIAFVYLIFPRDLIIDFHPFGVMDDLVVVGVLLTIFINRGSGYVARYDRGKGDAIDVDFQVLVREEACSTGDPSAPAPDPDTPADDTPNENLRSHQ
jgi:uncharacterized membrane protein YkvA (DUF1232 family)